MIRNPFHIIIIIIIISNCIIVKEDDGKGCQFRYKSLYTILLHIGNGAIIFTLPNSGATSENTAPASGATSENDAPASAGNTTGNNTPPAPVQNPLLSPQGRLFIKKNADFNTDLDDIYEGHQISRASLESAYQEAKNACSGFPAASTNTKSLNDLIKERYEQCLNHVLAMDAGEIVSNGIPKLQTCLNGRKRIDPTFAEQRIPRTILADCLSAELSREIEAKNGQKVEEAWPKYQKVGPDEFRRMSLDSYMAKIVSDSFARIFNLPVAEQGQGPATETNQNRVCTM